MHRQALATSYAKALDLSAKLDSLTQEIANARADRDDLGAKLQSINLDRSSRLDRHEAALRALDNVGGIRAAFAAFAASASDSDFASLAKNDFSAEFLQSSLMCILERASVVTTNDGRSRRFNLNRALVTTASMLYKVRDAFASPQKATTSIPFGTAAPELFNEHASAPAPVTPVRAVTSFWRRPGGPNDQDSSSDSDALGSVSPSTDLLSPVVVPLTQPSLPTEAVSIGASGDVSSDEESSSHSLKSGSLSPSGSAASSSDSDVSSLDSADVLSSDSAADFVVVSPSNGVVDDSPSKLDDQSSSPASDGTENLKNSLHSSNQPAVFLAVSGKDAVSRRSIAVRIAAALRTKARMLKNLESSLNVVAPTAPRRLPVATVSSTNAANDSGGGGDYDYYADEADPNTSPPADVNSPGLCPSTPPNSPLAPLPTSAVTGGRSL